MRVLLTVASRHGATQEIAEVLAGELATEGLRVEIAEPASVTSVAGYDAVVLGSGVYMGRWLPAARDLAARCAEELRERPVWLFSSGPVGDPPKPAVGEPADVPELIAETAALGHQLFAGRLERRRLRGGERAVVGMTRAAEGDFRDWDAVRAWGAAIRAELLPGRAGRAPGDHPEAPTV